MVDYSVLCLDGSKECTGIHELAYTEVSELNKLDLAHGAFGLLSLVAAIGPMFILNAWIPPESTRY